MTHPAVQDVVMLPVSDDTGEDLPVPHVKLDPQLTQAISATELLHHLSTTSNSRINLSKLTIVSDSIPRTKCGYICRHECRRKWKEPKASNLQNGSILKSVVPELSSKPKKRISEAEVSVMEKVVKNTAPLLPIPEIGLAEYVMNKLSKYGSRTCIINADSGQFLTFNEVIENSKNVGSALLKRGFHPRDVLCLYSPNHADFLVAILAVTSIGGIITLCNPSYTLEELKHQLSHSKSSYILTHKVSANKALDAIKDNKFIKVLHF